MNSSEYPLEVTAIVKNEKSETTTTKEENVGKSQFWVVLKLTELFSDYEINVEIQH